MSTASILPDERARLILFTKRARDLRSLGIARSGGVALTVSVSINKTHNAGVECTFAGHDEDKFRSTLITLRQFINNDDAVSINRIFNCIERKCPDDSLKERARQIRKAWTSFLDWAPVGYELNGRPYTVALALESLLYGGIVHTDQERQALLEQAPLAEPVFRFFVQSALPDMISCLAELDDVVRTWLGLAKEETSHSGPSATD